LNDRSEVTARFCKGVEALNSVMAGKSKDGFGSRDPLLVHNYIPKIKAPDFPSSSPLGTELIKRGAFL